MQVVVKNPTLQIMVAERLVCQHRPFNSTVNMESTLFGDIHGLMFAEIFTRPEDRSERCQCYH